MFCCYCVVVESCEEEESSNNEGYSSAGEESISGESAPDIADTECHDTLSARPEQPSGNVLYIFGEIDNVVY